MQNDPRRRRSRGGRRRSGGGGPAQDRARPTRTPAEPKATPQARGIVRRDKPRRRGTVLPRSPDDLRPGLPCVIVMDCREGEPDRTGAGAVFEGFFDLETGDIRRAGFGVPRLRITRALEPVEPAPAIRPDLDVPETEVRAMADERPDTALPARVIAKAPERLWGFECWWRPDPGNVGLTDADRVEVEQSKKLLRGLIRDSRRSTRPREVAAPPPPR